MQHVVCVPCVRCVSFIIFVICVSVWVYVCYSWASSNILGVSQVSWHACACMRASLYMHTRNQAVCIKRMSTKQVLCRHTCEYVSLNHEWCHVKYMALSVLEEEDMHACVSLCLTLCPFVCVLLQHARTHARGSTRRYVRFEYHSYLHAHNLYQHAHRLT